MIEINSSLPITNNGVVNGGEPAKKEQGICISLNKSGYNVPATQEESYCTDAETQKLIEQEHALVKDKMQEIADSVLNYCIENEGSLKDFKLVGFPHGITELSIKPGIGYDNSENDELKITDDGILTVDRVPDSININVSFKYKGRSYQISSKSEAYPWENKNINVNAIGLLNTNPETFGL